MKLKSDQSLTKPGFEPVISGLNATTLEMLLGEIDIWLKQDY